MAALLLAWAPALRAAESDTSLWATAQITVPITQRLGGELLVQPRFRDEISEFQLVVIRPSLQYLLVRDVARVAVGYDAIPTKRSRSNLEHRSWQELTLRRAWDPLELSLRSRFEQRYFDDADAVGLRTRFLVGARVPLTKGFDLALRNEFFFTMKDTSEGPSTGYDENRLFGGFGYRVSNRLRLETGYQMVYLERRGRNLINHTLNIGVSFVAPTLPGRDWFGWNWFDTD